MIHWICTCRKLWQGVQGSNEEKTTQCSSCCKGRLQCLSWLQEGDYSHDRDNSPQHCSFVWTDEWRYAHSRAMERYTCISCSISWGLQVSCMCMKHFACATKKSLYIHVYRFCPVPIDETWAVKHVHTWREVFQSREIFSDCNIKINCVLHLDMYCVCTEPWKTAMVMEYLPNGDLKNFLIVSIFFMVY